MIILVLNCGSSSIKFQLFEMPEKKVLVRGLIEKIGLQGGKLKLILPSGLEEEEEKEISTHGEGIQEMFEVITRPSLEVIPSAEKIDAVGHRVVHGGEFFTGSVLIDRKVIEALQACTDLAPLHNPSNLAGIDAISRLIPHVPQAGVFDTAFHQTMPTHAYLYGLPYAYYEKYRIRRYGFHGTSHRYVSRRACDILGEDISGMKIVTCHLGNGSSIAAIRQGVSVDTSMGMTPTEGLMMGTRSGDLDPGALLKIADKEDLSISQVSDLVNKKSGMLGISGISSDMRDIGQAALQGNVRAELALSMFAYRVKKYIGAYAAAMDGLDLVVLTGGIGENDSRTRERILSDLTFLGIELDQEENIRLRGREGRISKANSRTRVMVVPTNEELVIASETYSLVRSLGC
ncbi:MAG TPA: acetate kinase [Bacteroidales bacterium]|nr:acetate kinase [Bacteroidales bacterium]HNS46616.1 acetate kinase [Bacteroidales bacterium]